MLLLMFVLLLFQRRNGEDIPVAQTKNINHRRFAASFILKEVTNQDQDLYRCVTQSGRGSGVSNFAGLLVRGVCVSLVISKHTHTQTQVSHDTTCHS